ncbi:MAG: antibiotic biosynthesis monooxygenase [Methylophilaceae bacterium]
MITIGMNYQVIPGKEQEFESAVEAVTNALNQATGHEKSTLYKDCKLAGNYLIMSEWSDEVAYQTFIQSEAFRNVTSWGASNILSGRPKHQIYK